MKQALQPGELQQFYVDHLKRVLLPFWLKSTDTEDGGFFNCYDNTGSQLVSTDKYTWSQGRFVWMYAKLASMKGDTFTEVERAQFLGLAGQGAAFLMKHCLLPNGNCTFVMDKKGAPKLVPPNDRYDSSVFADCFVVAGLSKYALESGDEASIRFARSLYGSIVERIRSGNYEMAPYPTPEGYKSHNIPMILLNVTQELLEAEERFSHAEADIESLRSNMHGFLQEIMEQFRQEDGVVQEMISTANARVDTLLGRYCNPGHTIEDMWFVIHAARKLGVLDHYGVKACETTQKMIEIGWDSDQGGLLLFVDRDGGQPRGSLTGIEQTAMAQQVSNNWDNKLWWPHSEALYTTLLCYSMTGDQAFLDDYWKVHDYTFRTFPNPDEQVGEWIQIRMRNGEPINKVVALPVKDPYHIIRNVVYIVELLHGMK
ncbi:AGE family epimerase/isomerase [Paenibacillus sp. J2TS4]|uniref:AGE family epimerase/isomerase n=1 Tax=Paenibacillus sp. J2TS4 TaxID=2807194 RepID=UPI001B1771E2|nr:AGE family epimerase/isomerase [Paenibacillus sp. J2TS4]GIP36648.1 N-acylglucosamine 2-epimerase [Paenibacillus sp. J2TS4]